MNSMKVKLVLWLVLLSFDCLSQIQIFKNDYLSVSAPDSNSNIYILDGVKTMQSIYLGCEIDSCISVFTYPRLRLVYKIPYYNPYVDSVFWDGIVEFVVSNDGKKLVKNVNLSGSLTSGFYYNYLVKEKIKYATLGEISKSEKLLVMSFGFSLLNNRRNSLLLDDVIKGELTDGYYTELVNSLVSLLDQFYMIDSIY